MIDKITKKLASILYGISAVRYIVQSFSDFLVGLQEGWKEAQGNPNYDRKEFNKVTEQFINEEKK